jgi:hypothetical protein
MRQIHCAIEHLHNGDYECAITLAGAAEGMLPNTDEPTFRQKVKALSKSPEIQAAGGATGPNDYTVWLKHGGVENATIPAEESVALIWRAITKYKVTYNDLSPQMLSFKDWATGWLQKDLNSN